jgi:poly(A) polymerase
VAPEATPGTPVESRRAIPRKDLDADAVKIVQRLARFDHQAYLVGGCVRDLLVGLKPKDFDVGTSATPRQVRRLFRNCRIIGRRFRLAHIYFSDGKIIEVATFRARNETGDAGDADDAADDKDLLIRDDNLFGTPAEDALRRDFTVNALFYDVNREVVVDYAGGLEDLKRKRIRTIGDPNIRFREDPIRILRAIRFAARLDFHIERGTLAALAAERGDIPKAAAPRVLEEINKFSRGATGRASFELLRSTGVFEVVLPEIAGAYEKGSKDWPLLLALLDRLDDHARSGGEVTTGAILAILLLPILRRKLGWSDDGTADPPRGLQVRDVANPILQPLALRLRVARKDQEYCRQLLLTLYRMIPVSRLRRNSRQSLLRRPCLVDAQWILDVLSSKYGGEFQTAHESFKDVQPAPRQDPSGERRRTRGGRRGRRGSGGARDTSGDERPAGRRRSRSAAPEPRSSPRASTKQDAPDPAKVGDDYFFSALPTVPDMPGDDDADRYGAADRVTGGIRKAPDTPEPTEEDASPQEGAEPETAEPGSAPRKRRRRRRPRRKRSGDGEAGK